MMRGIWRRFAGCLAPPWLRMDDGSKGMDAGAAWRFAESWADAWNRRDLDAVLAKYRDDARFMSPKAASFVGQPAVEGKAALRRYWEIALTRIGRLRFTLEQVVNDAATGRMVVIYVAELDGRRMRAAEVFVFAGDGRVTEGEALYGAALP